MTVQLPITQPRPPQPQSTGCWKWGLIGCGATVLGIFGFAVFVAFCVFVFVKSSDVYKEARSRVESDARVISAIGAPVKDGVWVSGTVSTSGRSGDADFEFPVHGPHGSGTVHVTATREAGVWSYTTLTFSPRNAPTIDLLKQP